MINHLIDASARNRFLILLLAFLATAWGVRAMFRVPLDAIPDLSDPQVIVFSEWPGRSPQLVEDQITYPIVSSLLAAPRVKAVRGQSMFGDSFVYVIFEDGTDLYWARSRVLEYMQGLNGKLPEGVTPTLGPDATGVGWVYEYALVDESGQHNLADLRSFQDWSLRYWLQSVPGVAEVASVGGFVKQYQVNIDPDRLLGYNISLPTVINAIRMSNNDVGGREIEIAGTEHLVRGLGYITSTADIETIPVATNGNGTPILIRDLATVTLGPDLRRGIATLDDKGEVVGGIVVMRYGENALNVIRRVKAKLTEIAPSLPPGVKILPTYDRSDLILRAIDTLRHTLTEEMVIVSLVILIFLWHIPSAIIPILTIPTAIILAFIPMDLLHVTANIMSLGGIAVAIGAMVDAAIVVVEQTHKKLEHWQAEGRKGDYHEVVISAVKEVGGPSFFALLIIAVSFIPVFALEAQEGRLFRPLALTKNFSMAIAAVLAITLDPAIRLLFTRVDPFTFRPRWLCRLVNAILVGTIHSEENHPISRPLMRLYHPVVEFVLRRPGFVIATAVLVVLVTLPVFQRLGSEFMPPLNEGTILHMPTALPGISPTEARRVLQVEGKALMQFPEVEHVFGKIGRAQTPTDPAPLNMVETLVTLKPEEAWRPGVTWDSLLAEMDRTLRLPGMPNIWWMPIQTRTEMLATGIRSVLGIKVLGPRLEGIEQIGQQIEAVLAPLQGTRSVYYDRTLGGYYLDFHIKRDEAARYGLTVGDVEDIIETAIGGKNIAQTVEGRERYPINVRYARELRDDVEMLKRVLVPTPSGAKIPIVQLAELRFSQGPPMIRDELGQLVGFVFVDVVGRDLGGYVEEAKQTVAERVQMPPGYTLLWAGQFEYQLRAKETLKVVVPFTLLIVFLLLYLNTKSVAKTLIILVAVPFSAVGAIWLLYLLNYNLSVAVWVGLIALMGVDAETGMFMLLYLDLAYHERQEKGLMRSWEDLKQAVIAGAVQRLRPKVMTVGVMFLGLVPIMWSHGTGADVMKRIAAPMIGGIFTSFLLELVVYPAIFALWKWRAEVKPCIVRAEAVA
ncbi:MAG: efflux RND transporter permease subunit [Deltaproteobacteria bacterium]|nr:efflux RND transporter permease subunit [Deltaproteobacteria bacterium]